MTKNNNKCTKSLEKLSIIAISNLTPDQVPYAINTALDEIRKINFVIGNPRDKTLFILKYLLLLNKAKSLIEKCEFNKELLIEFFKKYFEVLEVIIVKYKIQLLSLTNEHKRLLYAFENRPISYVQFIRLGPLMLPKLNAQTQICPAKEREFYEAFRRVVNAYFEDTYCESIEAAIKLIEKYDQISLSIFDNFLNAIERLKDTYGLCIEDDSVLNQKLIGKPIEYNPKDLEGNLFTYYIYTIPKVTIDGERPKLNSLTALGVEILKVPTKSLFKTARTGNLGEVTQLLATGIANVNAEHQGATPLSEACLNGHIEIANLLIKNGACFEKALTLAYQHNNQLAIQALIQHLFFKTKNPVNKPDLIKKCKTFSYIWDKKLETLEQVEKKIGDSIQSSEAANQIIRQFKAYFKEPHPPTNSLLELSFITLYKFSKEQTWEKNSQKISHPSTSPKTFG